MREGWIKKYKRGDGRDRNFKSDVPKWEWDEGV